MRRAGLWLWLCACTGAEPDGDKAVESDATDSEVEPSESEGVDSERNDSEPVVVDSELPADTAPAPLPDLTVPAEISSTLIDLGARLDAARAAAGMVNFAQPERSSGGGTLAGTTLICEGLFGEAGELFVVGGDDTNVSYPIGTTSYDPLPTAFVPIWHLSVSGNDVVLSHRMNLSDVPGAAYPEDGSGTTGCADYDGDGLVDLVVAGVGRYLTPGGQVDYGGRVYYRGTPTGFVAGPEAWPHDQELSGGGSRNTRLMRFNGDWWPSVFVGTREAEAFAETGAWRDEGAVIAWQQVDQGVFLAGRGAVESELPMSNPYFLSTWTVPGESSMERYLYYAGDFRQDRVGSDLGSSVSRLRRTAQGDPTYLMSTHVFEEVPHLTLLPQPTVYSSSPPSLWTEPQWRNPNTWLPMGHCLTYHVGRDRLLGWTTSTRPEDPVWSFGGWKQAPAVPGSAQIVSGRNPSSDYSLWRFSDPGDFGRYWGCASFGDGRYLVQGNGLDAGERRGGAPDTMTDQMVFDVTGQGHYQRVTELTPLWQRVRSGHAISTAITADGRGVMAIGTITDTLAYNAPQTLYLENARGVLEDERYLGVWVRGRGDLANGAWVSVYRGDGRVYKRAMIGADDGQPTHSAQNDMVRFSIEAGVSAGDGPDDLHQLCVEYPNRLVQCVDVVELNTRVRVEEPELVVPESRAPLALGSEGGEATLRVVCPDWLACASVEVVSERFGAAMVTPDGEGWLVAVPTPSAEEAGALITAFRSAEYDGFRDRWQRTRGRDHLGLLPVVVTVRDAAGQALYEEVFNWHLEAASAPGGP